MYLLMNKRQFLTSCFGIRSKTKFALFMLLSFSSIAFVLFLISYYQQVIKMEHESVVSDIYETNGQLATAIQMQQAQQIPLPITTDEIDSITSKNDTNSIPITEQVPVLVFSAKRPKAIDNHLKQLKRLRPSPQHFPIIVSQDGDDQQVAQIIEQFVNSTPHLHHIKFTNRKEAPKRGANYYYIAQHYKFALDRVFIDMGFRLAIITEDDLDIADDFFNYFKFARPLLYTDPTIWCISAWNDNGNPVLVDWEDGINKLWRTDFFPGLGWMLKAEMWDELRAKWPDAFWDDWLRRPDVRKNRVCIRPEISRTLHNLAVAGKGSSNGLYKTFLSSIRLPQKQADFVSMHSDILQKENFDASLWSELRASKTLNFTELLSNQSDALNLSLANDGTTYTIRYQDPRQFRKLAQKFNLMADIRAGMARTAYLGVVPFRIGKARVFALHHRLNLSEPFGSVMSDQIYEPDWDLMSKYLDFSELFCTAKRWTGKCDPYDSEMRKWFQTKGWQKQVEQWGNMTVF